VTPLQYYQKKIASGEILEDPQQLTVMHSFDVAYAELTADKTVFAKFKKKSTPRGIYLWGNVGIGKTFLIDTFYYTLPFEQKLRIHFYAFMRQVHADLFKLEGTKNPLQYLAKQWAKKVRVICFDELIVNDIADAMVLGNLVQAFLDEGIYLIFTSNCAPDDLYKNGLQRELFIPTIERLKSSMEVIHLTIADDYRAQATGQNQYYWYPLNQQSHDQIAHFFQQATAGAVATNAALSVCGRDIKVQQRANKVIWFDFLDICGIPRSQEDYLAIVEQFDTILISNLIDINPAQNDLARSFIRCIDVLYDAKVRVVITAVKPIGQIYPAGSLSFEFVRTKSRVRQMTSMEWHRPLSF